MFVRSRRCPFDEVAFSKFVAFLVPALLPPAHIAVIYYFWKSYEHPVDRRSCTNSCWDTVFKGPYEKGVASYKHMYFNATDNTLKIWLLTVGGIIGLYESFRYLISLAFQRRLRFSMFLLYCVSLFSNYFMWWVYINYWNDEFYAQWNHQMFFTITEMVSTLLILSLADNEKAVTTRKTFPIIAIALLHMITASCDQFFNNVVFGHGERNQVIRDLGLMVADFLNVVAPLYELIKHKEKLRLSNPSTKTDLFLSVVFIVISFVIYSSL